MGKKDKRYIAMHFLLPLCKSFIDTLICFNFGFNTGVAIAKRENEKDIFEKRNQTNLPKIDMEDVVDLQVFCYRLKWGHMTNCKDMLQTCDWAKYAQKWPDIRFCCWGLGHVPVLKTGLGHGQDIITSKFATASISTASASCVVGYVKGVWGWERYPSQQKK